MRWTPVVVLVLVLVTALGGSAAHADSTPSPEAAVQQLNEWRARVGSPPVAHDQSYTDGCHAWTDWWRLNHVQGHDAEKPGTRGYTEAGSRAAQISVLDYGNPPNGPFTWENAPYHRTSLLNPGLERTGYWAEHGAACMTTTAEAANSSYETPDVRTYVYPVDGQSDVETTFYCNEEPNPCDKVPGGGGGAVGFIPTMQYTGPFIAWQYLPHVTSATMTDDAGNPMQIRVLDGTDNEAVLLDSGMAFIPLEPLQGGTTYTLSVTGSISAVPFFVSVGAVTDTSQHPFSRTWSFTTRGSKPIPPGRKLPRFALEAVARGRVLTVRITPRAAEEVGQQVNITVDNIDARGPRTIRLAAGGSTVRFRFRKPLRSLRAKVTAQMPEWTVNGVKYQAQQVLRTALVMGRRGHRRG